MTDFYLAYHGSNSENAVAISNRLEKSNYKITYIPIMGEAGPYLSERLITLKRPIILLVSDNFLKSTICMYDALSALRNLLKDELIYPVIVPGNYGKGADNYKVETKFGKVSQVLSYMSYWKDIYIDARKENRPFLDADKKQHNLRLQELKSIQSEAGEYIRQLRDIEHIRFEDILASDYELLYKFLSKQRYVNVNTLDSTPGSSLSKDEPQSEENKIQEKSKIDQIIEHKAQTSPVSQLNESEGFVEVKNIELDLSDGFSKEMISDRPLTDMVIPLEANSAANVDLSKKKATIKDAEDAQFDHTQEIINDSIGIFEAGQYEAGYMFLEDYLKYNPTNVKVRMHLANMRYDFGDKDLAADDVQYILKLDDTNIQAHKWVAEYFEISNQPTKALHHLLRVQLLEPDSFEIDHRLGLLLKNHIKDLSSAKSYFESALKKNPGDQKSLFQLGLINKEQGNNIAAKDLLEKTLNTKEEIVESDYEFAKVFMKSGDLEKVKHHWELALSQQPDLEDATIVAFLSKEEEKVESPEEEAPSESFIIAPQEDEIIEDVPPVESVVEEDELEESDYDLAKRFVTAGDVEKVKHHWALALSQDPTLENAKIDAYLAKHKKKQKQKERLESIRKSVESELKPKKKTATKAKNQKKKKKSRNTKTILITGATAGIGEATAKELANRGHRLILTGRRIDRLEALAQGMKKSKVKVLSFDVRNFDAAQDAVDSLSGKWASIDILINNAGLAQGNDPIHEADIEDWNTMIDTNVKGILHMTRLIAPSMAKRKKGQIINVCSTAGHEVYPGGSVYCASKFAVRALTKGMRMDLHQYNIRVCQVSPGAVEETEFSKVRFHGDEEKAKIYGDFTPVNSKDIAKVIRFMITRPKRVNIEDVLVMSTQQASATIIDRSGRKNG